MYNSLQHIKRLADIAIQLSKENGPSVGASVEKQFLLLTQFVEKEVLPSIERSKLRFEAYFLINEKVESYKERLMNFAKAAQIVGTEGYKIKLYVSSMILAIKKLFSVLYDNIFSNIFILVDLYYQFISGVFCTEKLTQDFMDQRQIFGLKRQDFNLPILQYRLEKIDVSRFLKRCDKIFNKNMKALCLVAYLNEALFYNNTNAAVQAVITECNSALDETFADFYPMLTANSLQVSLSLNDFFKKQLQATSCLHKIILINGLINLSRNIEWFEKVFQLAGKRTLSCKFQNVVYLYTPSVKNCDLFYFKNITTRYKFSGFKRALKAFYLGEESENFTTLTNFLQCVEMEFKKTWEENSCSWGWESLDIDAFSRCLFANVLVGLQKLQHIYDIVRSIDDFKRFVLIIMVFYNLLKVI